MRLDLGDETRRQNPSGKETVLQAVVMTAVPTLFAYTELSFRRPGEDLLGFSMTSETLSGRRVRNFW
jgi:hypothetical protein